MDTYCIHYIVNVQYVCGNNQSTNQAYIYICNYRIKEII